MKLLLGSFQDSKAPVKELEVHGLDQQKVMVGMEGDFVEGLMHAFATGAGSAAITAAMASLFGPGGFIVGLVVALFYMAKMLNRQLRADLGGYDFMKHQRARFMAWSLKKFPLLSSLVLRAGERIAAFRKRYPKTPYKQNESVLSDALKSVAPAYKGASIPTTRKGLLALLNEPLAASAAPARPAAAPVAEVPWSAFTHLQLRGVLVGAGEPLPLGHVDKAHLAKLVRDAAARKQFGICAVVSSEFQRLSTPQLVAQLAPLGDGARSRAALLAQLTANCKATRGATAW